MTPTQLVAALLNFAKADLRHARKCGEHYLTDTKRGTLKLSHVAGWYTVTTMAGEVLVMGRPAVVVPVLADLYTVETV